MEYGDIVEMFVSPRRRSRFREVASARLPCLTMVFDRIGDVHNENACIRVADSFGVGTVHHLADAEYRENLRISMASDRWVDVSNWDDDEALVGHLRDRGFTLAGAVVPADGGIPYRELALPERLAIIIGAERHGMSARMRELSDVLVTIPTYGFVDSLNLSTAAAILAEHYSTLYRLRGDAVCLSDEACEALVGRWVDEDLRAKLHSRGLSLDDMLMHATGSSSERFCPD